jgi:hypothetical protein
MDNEPEVIRRQMEETRASLADKIETLEDKVVGTLEVANSAVKETVENVTGTVQETVVSVKEGVSDTVQSMKDVFNLRFQVDRHPCLMMGAAVAAGYVCGSLLKRTGGHATRLNGWQLPSDPAWPDERQPAAIVDERHPLPAASSPNGATNSSAGLFAPELSKLKGMVVGYFMSLVRDAVSETLPGAMRPQFRETLDSMTQKLGGEPVPGPVLECADRRATSGQVRKGLGSGPYTESLR